MQWILMLAVFSNGQVNTLPAEHFTSQEECTLVAESFNQMLLDKGYTSSKAYCTWSQQ